MTKHVFVKLSKLKSQSHTMLKLPENAREVVPLSSCQDASLDFSYCQIPKLSSQIPPWMTSFLGNNPFFLLGFFFVVLVIVAVVLMFHLSRCYYFHKQLLISKKPAPVEEMVVFPMIYRVLHIWGGWPWDFWTINGIIFFSSHFSGPFKFRWGQTSWRLCGGTFGMALPECWWGAL